MEILDFYADWCGPCKMFAPTMDEFKTMFAKRLENQSLAAGPRFSCSGF